MFVAKVYGSSFDHHTKRSRWTADCLFNLGAAIEVLTILQPHWFLIMGSIANAFKAIGGLVGGATKASIHRHFAITHNLGDVTGKAASQGIMAYLCGSFLGIMISFTGSALFASLPPLYSITCFTLLSAGNLFC